MCLNKTQNCQDNVNVNNKIPSPTNIMPFSIGCDSTQESVNEIKTKTVATNRRSAQKIPNYVCTSANQG